MSNHKKSKARAILALVLGCLLAWDMAATKFFVLYSNFMGLTGADAGLYFDPYSVRWQPYNLGVLILNAFALLVLSFGLARPWIHWKFRFLIVLALLANLAYPHLIVLTSMTGFHLIPFSIMVVHGGAFWAWVSILAREGPPKPQEEEESMQDIKEIDIQRAKVLLDSQKALFVDVRDPATYDSAHIPGAQLLGDHNIADFIQKTDKSKTVVVYCYHGHSSQGAAAYLMEQGFQDVYSVIGGFEQWRQTEKIES